MNVYKTQELLAEIGTAELIGLMGVNRASRMIELNKIRKQRYFTLAESNVFILYGQILKSKLITPKFKLIAQAEIES